MQIFFAFSSKKAQKDPKISFFCGNLNTSKTKDTNNARLPERLARLV